MSKLPNAISTHIDDLYKARGRRKPRSTVRRTHSLSVEAWALSTLTEARYQDERWDISDEQLREMARVAGQTAARDGLHVLTECLQSCIYQPGGDGEYIEIGRWAADILLRMGIEER